jgi:hypothetical protein
MQAVFTLSGPNTYANGTAPTIGIRSSETLGLISLQITEPGTQSLMLNAPLSPESAQPEVGFPGHENSVRTYFITKSVSRAIASALMGAAAEL